MTAPILVGQPLTLDAVVAVARHRTPVALCDEARARIAASRAQIERIVAEGRTVYGVTTGFGKLANVRIEAHDVRQLQRNLVVSHAMDHVMEIADRAVVMRRGRTVGEIVPRPENKERIVSLIVGGTG